eukprot:TRINITY_DN9470_c0_g1_i1.p1 TRINITY_DN9470_c0_g1~~TRINITY_DN9470_c0_g1_i1.p1  ORF type:complete len:148 (+),score=34.10 TRINITY_DN9470_c0_g1_i1:432-875(+)
MTAINFFKQKKEYFPEKKTTGITIEDYFAEMEKRLVAPSEASKRRTLSTAAPGYRNRAEISGMEESPEHSWMQPVNRKYLRPLKFIKGSEYETRKVHKYGELKRPNSRNNKSTICSSLDNESLANWNREGNYTKYHERLIRRVTNKW